jgi:hypothetical protein
MSCASTNGTLNKGDDCSILIDDFEKMMMLQAEQLKNSDSNVIDVPFRLQSVRCFDSTHADVSFELGIVATVNIDGDMKTGTIIYSVIGHLYYNDEMKPILIQKDMKQKKLDVIKKT